MTVNSPTVGSRGQVSPNIDSRGPRFGAAITTVVLAVVVVTAGSWHAFAGWLLFAQTLVFAAGGVAGFAAGSVIVGVVFTALALMAAFLNAAFNFCLGCQVYLFIKRIRPLA